MYSCRYSFTQYVCPVAGGGRKRVGVADIASSDFLSSYLFRILLRARIVLHLGLSPSCLAWVLALANTLESSNSPDLPNGIAPSTREHAHKELDGPSGACNVSGSQMRL